MIVEYVDLLKRSILDSFWCYDELQLLQWLRLQFASSQWSFWTMLVMVNWSWLEQKNSYDKIYICCCYKNEMPSCPYFIFIDTSISKHVDIFFDFGFSLEDKRGLSLGELIRPFCIMLLYRYLLHYGLLLHIMSQYLCLFSLILQGLHEEGECRQLEFWAGKGANIGDLFYTTPKVLKLHESYFWK